jgi:hypothetical protein
VSAGNLSIAADGRTVVVKGLNLVSGAPLAIVYGVPGSGGPGATATTTLGASTWAVKELSTTVGTAKSLPAQSITVVAADGSGLLTANRSSVTHSAAHQTIRFTYTVWPGGMHGGKITLAVPGGWSAPSLNGTAAGYVSVSGAPAISVTGRVITVSDITKAAGATLVITYGSRDAGGPGATAPGATGTQTWTAKEQSLVKSKLTPLSVSPKIKVN